LYLQRLKQIEHIRDSLRHAQGMLRFAQNDTSVQRVITIKYQGFLATLGMTVETFVYPEY